MKALMAIQKALRVPKAHHNQFGGFKYRKCEDILEAVKPLLEENNATLTLSDDVVLVGDRVFLKATVTLEAGGETAITTGFAQHAKERPKFDEAQISGSASSYARKYALNGMFLIDDEKDPDEPDEQMPVPMLAAGASFPSVLPPSASSGAAPPSPPSGQIPPPPLPKR